MKFSTFFDEDEILYITIEPGNNKIFRYQNQTAREITIMASDNEVTIIINDKKIIVKQVDKQNGKIE